MSGTMRVKLCRSGLLAIAIGVLSPAVASAQWGSGFTGAGIPPAAPVTEGIKYLQVRFESQSDFLNRRRAQYAIYRARWYAKIRAAKQRKYQRDLLAARGSDSGDRFARTGMHGGTTTNRRSASARSSKRSSREDAAAKMKKDTQQQKAWLDRQ